MNVVFGWHCAQCNLDGYALDWASSQEALDQHWRSYHGRPMPEATELDTVSGDFPSTLKDEP